jgi:hypothetical protein
LPIALIEREGSRCLRKSLNLTKKELNVAEGGTYIAKKGLNVGEGYGFINIPRYKNMPTHMEA